MTDQSTLPMWPWEAPADGQHDVEMPEYLGWPLISASALGVLRARTPEFLKWSLDNREIDEDTVAKQLGTLTHTAVLEPDLLDALYIAMPLPDPDKHRTKDGKVSGNPANTTAYKTEVAALQADHPEKTLVDGSLFASALEMRDAVLRHPTAKQILEVPPPDRVNEASFIVTDESGIRCKVRPDILLRVSSGFWNINVKTTKNGDPDRFARDVWRYGYYRDFAFYKRMLTQAGFPVTRSVVLGIESSGPKSVFVRELDEGAIDAGEQWVDVLMRKLAKCLDRDEWPAFNDSLESMSLPPEAWDRIDEEITEYESRI